MIETNLKIEHAPDLGVTPAEVWHDTGVIVLNDRIWPTLPEGYKKFIIAHEEGHYYLETHDELLADKYAFDKLAGTFPRSLKTMIFAVCDILGNDPESEARKIQLRNLALEWDRQHPISTFAAEPYPEGMEQVYVPPVGRWFYAPTGDPVTGDPIGVDPVLEDPKPVDAEFGYIPYAPIPDFPESEPSSYADSAENNGPYLMDETVDSGDIFINSETIGLNQPGNNLKVNDLVFVVVGFLSLLLISKFL